MYFFIAIFFFSASRNPENFNLPIDYAFSEKSWGNFFYKVYNTPVNYGNAKAQCESDGTFLAIPRSQVENDFLTSLLSNQHIWIGINDIEQEGKFVAVDGREISWTNWLSGQPDGGTRQKAVKIDGDLGPPNLGRWRDWGDSANIRFVCSIYIQGTNFPFEFFRPFLSQIILSSSSPSQ